MPDSMPTFAQFFAAVNGGRPPFAWQQRLADHVVSTGRWPDAVTAPTGAGKSSVVDVHVFACAVAAGTGVTPPRRLAVVVNRRALVDHHVQRAQQIQRLVDEAEADPAGDRVLVSVAQGLRALTDDPTVTVRPALAVHSLRGGISPERSWVDDPTRCAVIGATPNMWGSRLLLRGYGSSRPARPREAGLLAIDSVMVLDEAHLNRQLLHTARAVAHLVRRDSAHLGRPVLQVVETTATPDDHEPADRVRIGVDRGDLESDPVLAARVDSAKKVVVVESEEWPKPARGFRGKATAKYADELAEATEQLVRTLGRPAGGRTVGCVVNRVAVAAGVAANLRARGFSVELRVGPMRPWDLDRQLAAKPGLYTIDGDPDTDVLVATQTIEVGVDLDLAGMVTEIAPGSALAQRAGRVNRLGRSAEAVFAVVVPADPGRLADDGPYALADLEAAVDWIRRRADAPDGVSPAALMVDVPPEATLGRPALSTLTSAQAELWSATSDGVLVEPSLDLYLRDSLSADPPSVGVVVRSGLPRTDDDALALLAEVPPQAMEVFPAGLVTARELLSAICSGNGVFARAFLVREDTVIQTDADAALRPGDVLVVDDFHPVVVEGVPVSEGAVPAQAVPWAELNGVASLVVDPALLGDESDEGTRAYAALCSEFPDDTSDQDAAAERDRPYVLGAEGDSGLPSWILVRSVAEVVADDSLRQVQSTSRTPVLLDDHQREVAARADRIATTLGLPEELRNDVVAAGLHHDDGKEDPRFQVLLGRRDGLPPLAKSKARSRKAADAAYRASGLPSGWRHEQASVAMAVAAGVESEIALRLIGTSHGWGRPWFRLAASLTADQTLCAPVEELFVIGRWAEILESTQRDYGVWGCAFLEAVVRAADNQVSGEGH